MTLMDDFCRLRYLRTGEALMSRHASLLVSVSLATLLWGCGQPAGNTPPSPTEAAQTSTIQAVQAQGPRYALVIANARYDNVPKLKNPDADSRMIAQSLRDIGYEVDEAHDANRQSFIRALQRFRDRADRSSVAVVYYAGHGMEVGGRNWLIPVDATLADERDLPVEAIDLSDVLATVEGAKGLRIVVLDACRDNPYARSMRRVGNLSRGLSRGLGEIEASGTLVVYSAKAGSTADDGDGLNSPFAAALSRRIREPVDVRILFAKVRDDVLATTDKRQEPYNYGSLPGINLYLSPPDKAETPSFTGAPMDADDALWQGVSSEPDIEALRLYRRRYPEGKHVGEADERIALLEVARRDDESFAAATTAAGLRAYLTGFPEGRHGASAREKLIVLETGALARARSARTSAALTTFLRDWPDSSSAGAVTTERDRLAQSEARTQTASVTQPRKQGSALPPPPPPPPPPAVIACPTSEFVVYFEWDRANINQAAAETMDAAVARARQCNIAKVQVVGHTDTSASSQESMNISVVRANVVRAYLAAAGIPERLITSRGAGETELARATSDGVREPLNRRTSVVISFR